MQVRSLVLAMLVLAAPAAAEPARRVVSMNPSLTRILIALGAADTLVGVDAWSATQQPAVAGLPRVGGLYDPSLEAVVALEPDLVTLVPSYEQRDFRARLEALGIPVLGLAPDPVTFEQVLVAIERLGARVGREPEASRRVAAIRQTRAAVAAAVRGRGVPRVVLVLTREPLFLAGAGTFLDDLLQASGARNLGAGFGEAWPRASREWLIEAAPEILLDTSGDAEPAAEYWARWPSLPAVADGRVVSLPAEEITLPGPDLDRALLRLARAIHGDAILSESPAVDASRAEVAAP